MRKLDLLDFLIIDDLCPLSINYELSKNEIRTLTNTIQKNKLNMEQRLKFKARHYKTLRGNHRQSTLWHNAARSFLTHLLE